MKTLKALTLGLLAGASFGTLANAQVTTLHVGGSSSFRAPATAAIIDYLANTNNPNGGVVYGAWDGTSTSLLGANGAILANGTIGAGGTATIIIETYWTGAAAGVIDLVAGNAVNTFLDPSSLPTADLNTFNNESGSTLVSTSPYGGGTVLTSTVKTSTVAASGTILAAPDAAFSDANQNTVALELSTATLTSPINGYTSAASLAAAITSGAGNIVQAGTGQDVTNGFDGIDIYEWVAGKGVSGISNITQQAARALISTGKIAQALLTGGNSAADVTNQYYLIGRNEDAAVRLDAFEEAQFGVTANPKQYTVSTAGAFSIWPSNSTLFTEPLIKWTPSGHSGYPSSSNEASAIDIAETAPNFGIGYVGISDGATAVKGGGTLLSYNGVLPSTAAVQNGSYSFWAYNRLYKPITSTDSTPLGSIIDGIADNVYNTDADVAANGLHAQSTSPGVLYSTLNVSRTASVEGQPVTHN